MLGSEDEEPAELGFPGEAGFGPAEIGEEPKCRLSRGRKIAALYV